jgi:hypothetical protein
MRSCAKQLSHLRACFGAAAQILPCFCKSQFRITSGKICVSSAVTCALISRSLRALHKSSPPSLAVYEMLHRRAFLLGLHRCVSAIQIAHRCMGYLKFKLAATSLQIRLDAGKLLAPAPYSNLWWWLCGIYTRGLVPYAEAVVLRPKIIIN